MPTNDDTLANGGKIQVYHETNDGTFEKKGKAIYGMSAGDHIGGYNDHQWLQDDDLNQDDRFSTESYDSSLIALSENGTILTMGSPIGNYVRVFVLDVAQNEWLLYGDNTVFVGEAQGDKFGTSVDISADGTRVVIGARNNTGKADPSYNVYNGHARVFQYMQETSTWIKLGQDLDGTKGEEWRGEQAGSSVSMSSDGSTISVAANLEASSEDIYDLGSRDGYVRVYSYDDNLQEWLQQGNTINVFQFGLSGATFDDEIVGITVALKSELFPINARLSGDGRRVLLSVLAESLNDRSARGVVRLYELHGETWEIVADPIEGTAPFDHSGRSIALSYNGTRIAFGAPQHNRNSPDDGQVMVFETERRTGDPPTEDPSTAPTVMPTRLSTMVPITLLLSVGSSYKGNFWSLECGGVLVTNETVTISEDSTSARNISKTWQVSDGSVCQYQMKGLDIDFYAVFYGNTTESPIIVAEEYVERDQFAFAVTGNPASIIVLIQGDAHAEETSWILQCGHVTFAERKLGDITPEPYEISSVTVMGIADGSECEFTIKDSFGDGLCCSKGQGYGFYGLYYGDVFSTAASPLAQGGDFASEERSVFEASSIPSPAPVAAPSSSKLPITVVIQLDEESSAISLLCDNEVVGFIVNFDDLNEPQNITKTYYVNDGALCHLGVQRAWYSLYLGESDANGVLILEGAASESGQVSFTVEPGRPSLAITLSIRLDEYPDETRWSLVCNGNSLVSSQVASYTVSFENITTTRLVAVDASCIFTIEDSNGLCCEYGEGFYRLYVGESVANGTLFAGGGVFNSTETVSFEVEQDQVVLV
jgi:hypothetical protein